MTAPAYLDELAFDHLAACHRGEGGELALRIASGDVSGLWSIDADNRDTRHSGDSHGGKRRHSDLPRVCKAEESDGVDLKRGVFRVGSGNHPPPDELWLMRALRRHRPPVAKVFAFICASLRAGPVDQPPWEVGMSNQPEASAIIDYLNSGGQVRRGIEPTPATAQEIIAYLAARGIQARYHPGDSKLYLCRGKRVSATALVVIANRLRYAENAQPFALRLNPFD